MRLSGSFEQIFKRIDQRSDHYMPSELLKPQFDILENPKDTIEIDISSKPENIIKKNNTRGNVTSDFGLFGIEVTGKAFVEI